MTIEQAKALKFHDTIHYGICKKLMGKRGGVKLIVENWRINGAVRLWKTMPERIEIPVKYGFNGPYGYLNQNNVEDWHLSEECKPVELQVNSVKP